MSKQLKERLRFRLRDILVVFLGIAIGYSLNPISRYLSVRPNVASTPMLPYVIEPPDILSINATGDFTNSLPSIAGRHLIGPDGKINLGAFGNVFVAGYTIAQAQRAIQTVVGRQVELRDLSVDVFAYNSKFCYVITRSNGADNVIEVPITGNETVLDAVAHVGGVPQNGRLWISRATPNGGKEKILPVAWDDISAGASTATNYQLWPRDRLYMENRSAGTKPN